jgi:acyl phosphate:glycerol-3-phosphate acyltransferase
VPIWQTLAATLAAYVLGCFTSAYYLVRLVKGQDIRQLGTGTVGGRNAGRVLGKAGFVAVGVLDALKGLLAVVFARYLGVTGWWLVPVLIAVVAGHIWPAQLSFRGGKGIATMIGALLAYNYLIPLVLLVLFLVGFAVLRSITLSGMLGIALLPFVLLALGQPPPVVVSVALLAIIVLFANRTNIRARLSRRPSETS